MAVYNLSPIFQPQFVSAASTALTFAPSGGGTTVPANLVYQIACMRVSNVTSAPVSLQVWRVPSGSSADSQHLVVPSINVPVASNTFVDLDLTALWGAVLKTGDAIYAAAESANALVIQADGAVIQP